MIEVITAVVKPKPSKMLTLLFFIVNLLVYCRLRRALRYCQALRPNANAHLPGPLK
jgi:hypothetical protein